MWKYSAHSVDQHHITLHPVSTIYTHCLLSRITQMVFVWLCKQCFWCVCVWGVCVCLFVFTTFCVNSLLAIAPDLFIFFVFTPYTCSSGMYHTHRNEEPVCAESRLSEVPVKPGQNIDSHVPLECTTHTERKVLVPSESIRDCHF